MNPEELVKEEWSKLYLKDGDKVLHFYCIDGFGSEYEKYSVGVRRAVGHYILGTVVHRPTEGPKFSNYLDVA